VSERPRVPWLSNTKIEGYWGLQMSKNSPLEEKPCDESLDISTRNSRSQTTRNDGLPHFGSKAWADELLKIGIASIRYISRVPESRLQEFVYQSRLLSEQGFTWHAYVLRAWAHRYWWSLRPSLKKADPSREEGGSSK
jgi:hypothetical protein